MERRIAPQSASQQMIQGGRKLAAMSIVTFLLLFSFWNRALKQWKPAMASGSEAQPGLALRHCS
jgi:hypothetical protein